MKPFSKEKALPKSREQELKEEIKFWKDRWDISHNYLDLNTLNQKKAELKGIAEGRQEANKQFAEFLKLLNDARFSHRDIEDMIKEKIRELTESSDSEVQKRNSVSRLEGAK